jgi:hypothetical protein
LKSQLQRWRKAIFVVRIGSLAMALGATGVAAQITVPSFDATHLAAPAELDGTWRMHAGDDPSFANPAFDDSRWTPFDVSQPITRFFPEDRPEVVWYRLRVLVDPTQTGLALREQTLSHASEVYVNGESVMTSGSVAPYRAYTYDAMLLRRIPDRLMASGTLTIAVRAHVSPYEWRGSNPGLAAGNLSIGQEETLYREDWLAAIGQNLLARLDSALDIAVGLVALVLFAAQRRQYEYLWIFVLGLIRLAELPVQIALVFVNLPAGWKFLNAGILTLTPYAMVAMYFAFVNLRIDKKFAAILVVAGLLNGYSTLHDLAPELPGAYGLLSNLPFVILLSVVTPWVLAIHWRRGNREAGILLIPAALFSLYIYANYALVLLQQMPSWTQATQRWLNLIQNFPAGPFSISLNSVSGILSTMALAVIIVLRSSSTSRRQAVLEGELEAAREVQQVILPDQIEVISGFAIESAYEPAQQVGGDFFQIVPTGDGGLLLVLGDVAGKGLPAAMLVSVMVGAIRATAEYTHDPEELLASLNERLMGRSRGGFSTALAAHIGAEGEVTIANAGHLSPYLDGRELELPGALPLGILSGAHYETMRFALAPGSRLTFYSDGVVEAQNAGGELLGFERAQELSTQPAAAIVEAAKEFGQSDDITVVAIERSADVAEAA